MTQPIPTAARSALPRASTKCTIICGTDFSEQAAQAVEAGAALAEKGRQPLVLVHAVNQDSRAELPEDVRQSLCIHERAHLELELQRLRAANVEVTESFRAGKPDAVLLEAAMAQHAGLLVISSHGHRRSKRWVLGSTAERIAEASPVPTLVVRTAVPFTAWARGKRRLRVFVGADFSTQSEAALRWVAWLRQLGPCDVVVTYLEPTLAANGVLDMMPTSAVVQMLARTGQVEARSFRQQVRAALGARGVRVHIAKGWGRSDAHLIEMARREGADLIVVGTHQRHGLGRVGHVSVSRGVLHYASMSVACVPGRGPLPETFDEKHVH